MAEKVSVREKLASVLYESRGAYASSRMLDVADYILQSPELRVELVEPRYEMKYSVNSPNPLVWDNRRNRALCEFYESAGYARESADHLADWLNTKEGEKKDG